MTSLREQERRTNTIVGRLILQWKTPQNSHKVLLLVEGPQDVTFYSRYFNEEVVGLRPSDGCSSMRKVYAEIQNNASIFAYNLAICDSDFLRVNGNSTYGDNVFYSDTHDHEMMCICNRNSFGAMLSFVSPSLSYTIFETIAIELKELSLFKWYNYSNHFNCRFNHLDLVGLSQSDLSDYTNLYTLVSANSPKMSGQCTLESLQQFALEKETYIDWAEITNGHDFIKRFVGYCKRNSMGQFSEKKLRSLLHENFRREDFAQTQLYDSIRRWEELNSKQIVLS